MSRALYIGRFQPFHKGHLMAIKWILEKEKELVIGIGSCQYSHSIKNPFTLGERMLMIWLTLKSENLCDRCILVPIPDTDSKHAFWVKVVQYCAPPFSRVYSNDPLTRLLFEEEGIPVHSIPFFDREKLQGTFIRRLIAEGNPLWESLVPDPVKNIIKEIGGEKRLRKIFEIQKQ